ncbi:ribosome maturation factor RimM [Adhaeribacter terreus]|uniref:Ribosome maturation factor RimM n=1 Tax=Adhaeribacter terreus TaxID=529703 RepID=A0ABW0E9G6_9BACT
MKLDDCFELGYIVKTHGVKGQVVALFDVDYPEDYEELESVFLLMAGKLVPFFIERIEPQAGAKFIIKFEDLNTIAEAEKLKSTTLYLPLSELPELDDDQFYFHETVGYQVIDENLGELGTVKEFYEMPNQDLMAMEYQGHEILIPVADDIILKTDKVAKKIFVKMPDGLMEVYTQPTNRHEEEYDGDEDYSEEK